MGGGMGSMLYIIMLVAVFWFLLIRPQQAQAKKRAEMLTALKTGDKVVTIGGICGKVAQITDNKIFVEVSDGIVVEFLRNAISTVEVEE
ncbi:MAG: preprotein translocase subunit YajC, partial [Peptococcaceae bacterium]|nr:preprotein translocase subunit YajC [Peptococcaceae bacterium]